MSQQVTGAPSQPMTVTAPSPGARFRPEVQGLRALAVLMVVTYHIWFNRVSGGVDIFLLISAFLLSLSFMRRIEAGRPLELGRHWLHRFKRLLPAVVVVLLGTLTATALVVPRYRWSEILSQTWSSLLYFQNWALAEQAVDYYADTNAASPLQHFWSLSVQGQVFILWPLLFAAAGLLARYGRIPFRRVGLLIFGSVFAVSLAFSIAETYSNQSYAYFDTRTRLWEFAFGTLLALALPHLRLPRTLRVAAGWLGLAAMLSCGFLIDVQGQFPGYIALWPLLAAALIITAGQTESRLGADRLLSWQPLIKLGDISYALYLWHWPILVIYLIWRGREEVGLVGGAGIIGLSLILAWLTTKLVENPLRASTWLESSRRRSAIVIAVCVALVAGPVSLWQEGLRLQAERLTAEADRNNPGAAVLLPGYGDRSDPDAQILPLLTDLSSEWGELDGDCSSYDDAPSDPLLAERCGATSIEDYDKTILLLGDSHSQQWLGSIRPMAEERGYRVLSVLLGGCKFGGYSETRWQECNEFNQAALDYAVELHPDLVLFVGTEAQASEAADPLVPELEDAAAALAAEEIPLVGIRDNPRFEFNMVECTEDLGADAPDCNPGVNTKLSPAPEVEAAFADLPGAALLDMTDLICPETCSPIIGNVRVYMDDNHLTGSYTASMHREFDRRLHDLVGW